MVKQRNGNPRRFNVADARPRPRRRSAFFVFVSSRRLHAARMRLPLPCFPRLLLVCFGNLAPLAVLAAQPAAAPFRGVNPLPPKAPPALRHATFASAANHTEVGYVIALPVGYDDAANRDRRYPVLYWLHGGRPGSETKNINVFPVLADAQKSGALPPLIVVFPNGGRLSHYDQGESKGEQAFLELIRHVDATYRTLASASGRAVEGMSQGGRAVGRYLFKHPELFCSAVALSGGHQREKIISENHGRESDTVTIDEPRNNVFDAASAYAARRERPPVHLLVVVGDKDENLGGNRDWSAHLQHLGIEHRFIVVPGVGHNARKMFSSPQAAEALKP
jgi:endo-1,4-beta-xylanase